MDADSKEIVYGAVGTLSCDFIKLEQKIALELFLQDHAVFVSLLTGYGKFVTLADLPATFDELLKRTSPSTSIVVAMSPIIYLMEDQVISLSTNG